MNNDITVEAERVRLEEVWCSNTITPIYFSRHHTVINLYGKKEGRFLSQYHVDVNLILMRDSKTS